MRMWKLPLMAALAILASPWAMALENPASQSNPNDPSVNEVYAVARAGHLDQARQMMDKVLANHPQSARAHYVAAELDADLKNYGEARQELQTAERLAPGLPSIEPASVAALRRQIGLAAPATGGPAVQAHPQQAYHPARSFPWATVLIIGAVVLIVWSLFRRRQAAVSYNPYGGTPGSPLAPGMGPGPMVPPASGFPNVVGGGVGSGIVGGLASGLAVGAGVAVGEELVGRAFGHGAAAAPAAERVEEYQPPPDPNPDLGGPDFGISDGSGWDDGGGGGGGDDGSWT